MDDLRDVRGRLIRLAVAAGIGLAVTIGVMWAIASISIKPNFDPVGGSSVMLLAIFVFVVTTAAASAVLSRRR